MRRSADAKAAGACGETSAAMAAFSMNQHSALCLPLVTDSQKLVWVHSNQISPQLDGAGELLKAFHGSPYLTKKETAALAQRCSLPADQVKVWFMVQRLRYGISWDYEDIREVQRKFKSSQRKARREQDLQDKVGESARGGIKKKKKKKRKEKEYDGKREGKVRWAYERGMMGKNLRVRKMEQARLQNKERERKDKMNACKEGMEITHPTVGEGRMTQGDDGMMGTGGEMRSLHQVEREGLKSIQSEPTNKFVWVSVCPAEQVELLTQLHDVQTKVRQRADVAPTTSNFNTGMFMTGFEETPVMETRMEGDGHGDLITDVDMLQELLNISPAVDTSQRDPPAKIHNQTRSKKKTDSQLRILRAAFRQRQYPNVEDFDYLTQAIGLPCRTLMKWFSDMRYTIKKRRPPWVSEEEHKKMLSNISYWQEVETKRKRCSAREKTQSKV